MPAASFTANAQSQLALLRRLERVQQIIEADRQQSDTLLTCGPLQIDPPAYRVTLNGELLDLTRTEFDLLALLMRSPGRICARMTILEKVWDYDFDPGTNLVDVYVRRLRRKLEAVDRSFASIETVVGAGYRWVQP